MVIRQSVGRGFTLIELLVVLAIVATLLTLAVPRYFHSIDVSKDSVLKENLAITRDTINKFYSDNGRFPETLQELVDKKYLRTIPTDPEVGNNTTWILIAPDDTTQGNVADLKSGAPGNDPTGRPFSEY